MPVHKKTVVFGLFCILSLTMLWGLFVSIIPLFPEHSFSMIVGVLGYLSLAFIILTSEFKHHMVSRLSGSIGLLFILIHLFLEMNVMAAIRFPAMTNPFGYAALVSFLVALIMRGLSFIDQWQTIRQYVHGVLTIGMGFVYWHVASIGIVAATGLFFFPFTAILVWTLFHFGVVIVFRKNIFTLSDTE